MLIHNKGARPTKAKMAENLKREPHFGNKIFYELINIYQSQES